MDQEESTWKELLLNEDVPSGPAEIDRVSGDFENDHKALDKFLNLFEDY